ncbi:hypothetical protein [Clostridium estertheticum]|nr:hypothetical protein [Clostridium estertheticum]MBU3187654.1 hypothetical protein [Clostridium estertheticum]
MSKFQFILAALALIFPYVFNDLSFKFKFINGKVSLIIKFGKKNKK